MLKLIFNAFSFQKNSLRRPTLKRILVVFTIIPLMIFHVGLTHLFLFLDTIIFPKFRSKRVGEPVFIVGVPRSGTSFLLNLMASNKANFTSFKLWELVFAPSIIQKKFWLGLRGFLIKVGFPFHKVLGLMDTLFFKKMKGIHDLGLQAFEEDEMVYLYLFKSVYLMYIFPELEAIHQFVYPDNSDNLESRIKQQRFYKSLIKRHLYVFNENNDKQFLSKNPIHLIRLESLTMVFPNAKHLLLQRPLEKTIPSTISLNENLYSFFCTLSVAAASVAEIEDEKMGNNDAAVKVAATVRGNTIKMLVEWQGYIQDFDNKNDWERLEIDFKNMVKSPSSEAKRIHDWLNLPLNDAYKIYLRKQDEFSRNYESRHTYEELTEAEISLLKSSTDIPICGV